MSVSASGPVDAGPAPQDDWIEAHLLAASPRARTWLEHAADLRLQILIAIVRQPDGGLALEEHRYRVDAEYLYPASAIKTFMAVAALRTLRALGEQHGTELGPATRIQRCRDDRGGCEPPPADAAKDQQESERPKHDKLWVGQEIHKMLSYSDNDSYDRLYDIVGHRELNEQMAQLGFSSVRFHHRMNTSADLSKRTPQVLLLPPGGRAVRIPRRQSDFEPSPTPAEGLSIGTAHIDRGGRVDEPMSFAAKNYASLQDMLRLNVALLFPTSPGAVDLGLTAEERALMIEAMTGRLQPLHHAEIHKPLLPGVLQVLPVERIRYVGKSGRAYGFHLENAYIEDQRTGRGVFVVASIYANPNGVLNDNDYDYDDTSSPFFEILGATVARAVFGDRDAG